MSADELRHKVQQRQRRARFAVLREAIIGLILFVFFARWFTRVHEEVGFGLLSVWTVRMGLGLLSFWCICAPFLMYKWIWPGRLAPDATLNTTLQSYRNELEKRRDFSRRIWLVLTPYFVGVAMVGVPALISALGNPREFLLNSLPLFVLLAIWLPIFLYLRKRRRGRLQQEIEQLLTFERENRCL